MANFCKNCGNKLTAGAKFCRKCGARIEYTAPAQNSIPETAAGITRPAGNAAAKEPHGSRTNKKAAGRSGLSIFLAAAIVVEFLVAGLGYPGFLIRDPGEQGTGRKPLSGKDWSNPEDGTSGNPEGMITAENPEEMIAITVDGEEYYISPEDPDIEVTAENSPGNPRFISIRYSEEEIEQAPVFTAAVSSEEPSADLGNGISADLFWWNLEDEPDELVVKTLPEKADEVTGERMIGYDFSLSSGKHEFNTIVELTIPRTATDETEGGVMYFNEETGEWERVYYEVSADGSSYLVHMNHFSTISELLFGSEREKLTELVTEGGIFSERNLAARPKDQGIVAAKQMAEYQGFNDGMTYATRKVSLVNLNKVCAFIARYSANSQSVVNDYILKKKTPITTFSAVDELNTIFGLGDGVKMTSVTAEKAASAAAPNAAGTKIMTYVVKSPLFTNAKALKLATVLSRGANILLGARILLQCFDKNLTWGQVAEDNKWAVAGAVCGAIASSSKLAGMTLLTGAGAAVAVGVFVCTTVYAGVKLAEKSEWFSKYFDPLDPAENLEESAYHLYLRLGNDHIYPPYTLTITGCGFAETFNEIYKNKELNFKGNYNEYYRVVTNIIDSYIDEFWAMSDDQIREFIKKNINWASAPAWERPPETYVREYKYRARQALYTKIRPMLQKIAQEEYEALVLEYTRYMEDEVLPVLNTEIYFVPKDTSLAAGENPSHSAYLGWNGEEFVTENGKPFTPGVSIIDGSMNLRFMPQWALSDKVEDYLSADLKLNEKNETQYLYKCTVFHYLQTGTPCTFSLSGPWEMSLDKGLHAKANWEKAEFLKGDSLDLFNEHYVVPVEYDGKWMERKQEVYKLKIIQDETMGYYSKTLDPDYEELPGGKKPECTLIINEDRSLIMFFDDDEFEGEAYIGDKHYIYANSRQGFNLEGQIYDKPEKSEQHCVITSVDRERITGRTLWSTYTSDPDHADGYAEYTTEISEIRIIPKEEVQNWRDGIYKGPKPSASEMTLQFDNGRLIKIELYLNSDEDVTDYKENGEIDKNRGGHGYKAKKIVLEVIP